MRLTLFPLALLAALTIVATSSATVVQEGNLRISISTRLSPYRLPRKGTAPITAFIAGHVFTADGTTPPQLKQIDIEINRHGHIEAEGLAVCRLSQIKATSTEKAIAACGASLVGSGHFWASVVFNEEALPYHTTGRLLAFNGTQRVCSTPQEQTHTSDDQFTPAGRVRPSSSRTQGGRQGERTSLPGRGSEGGRSPVTISPPEREQSTGDRHLRDPRPPDRGQRNATCRTRPALLIHIYTTQPFPSAFVVVFRVKKIADGPYGTQLSASLPQALGDWGFVNRIKMNIGRDYTYEGKRRGYLEAGCPALKGSRSAVFPLAHATFSFAQQQLAATVPRSCAVGP